MRAFFGTLFLLVISFVIFFLMKGGVQQSTYPLPEDDEQKGLTEQIVINFSHVVAENTPKGLAAQKFADLVKEKTDGKVKVEVFPNGSLYSDGEEIDALRRGDVEMIAPAYSKLTGLVPKWQVLDLPYVFLNYEDVEQAYTGEIGSTLLKSLQSKDIKGLALWSNGFKQMTSNNGPLIHPRDFWGQRFRIMPSDVIKEQFKVLNVRTSVIPFNKVYRNLESRFIDGQENTISNIYSKKFYLVQDYMTISNHGYLGYAVLMNEEFWDSLPKDVQQIIIESLDETRHWLLNHSIIMNKTQLENIKKLSDINIYVLTPEEKKEWMNHFKPLYKKFEGVIGKKLMDEVYKLHEDTGK